MLGTFFFCLFSQNSSFPIVIYVGIVKTFLFKFFKFRASAVIKGSQSCQNGTLKYCLAFNPELIFDYNIVLK